MLSPALIVRKLSVNKLWRPPTLLSTIGLLGRTHDLKHPNVRFRTVSTLNRPAGVHRLTFLTGAKFMPVHTVEPVANSFRVDA